MQADDLKAIRAGLGMSQQAFADALGMSRKAVNEMENGKAAIEARTEKLIDASLRHHIDVSYSGVLGKWTVAVRGPASPSTGAHRVHTILCAERDFAKAEEFAEAVKRERFPLAFVTYWPGPAHGPE